MNKRLKRHFWIANLLVIGASAVLVARIGNSFVGAWLEPAPLLSLESTGDADGKPVRDISLLVSSVNHVFGIQPLVPRPDQPRLPGDPPWLIPHQVPGQPEPKLVGCESKTEPVRSNLRLQLLATMIANERQWSSALILDLERKTSRRFVVGERIRGFDICDVVRSGDRDQVLFVNTETRQIEFIDDSTGGGAMALADVAGPTLAQRRAPDDGKGITKTGEHEYSITRESLASALASPDDLFKQARVVPAMKGGQRAGFKVFSIQPGSVYEQLGIGNGDIIESINGLPMDSPEHALAAYQQLITATTVEISLDRRGQPVKSSYSIVGGN